MAVALKQYIFESWLSRNGFLNIMRFILAKGFHLLLCVFSANIPIHLITPKVRLLFKWVYTHQLCFLRTAADPQFFKISLRNQTPPEYKYNMNSPRPLRLDLRIRISILNFYTHLFLGAGLPISCHSSTMVGVRTHEGADTPPILSFKQVALF